MEENCRLEQERGGLFHQREEETSSFSCLSAPSFSSASPSPLPLVLFSSYASSPSLFSSSSFPRLSSSAPSSCLSERSLVSSRSSFSFFSTPLSPSSFLPRHPRVEIFLARVLTELRQLELHVSLLSYPRALTASGNGPSVEGGQKEGGKNRKEQREGSDVLSAVFVKIPEGLEEAICRQRALTTTTWQGKTDEEEEEDRHDSLLISSSRERKKRETEKEKHRRKDVESVTRLCVYGGFSLRVYIHLETLLFSVGLGAPLFCPGGSDGKGEKDKKNVSPRDVSVSDFFLSNVFLEFALEVCSDYPFKSPCLFFRSIVYKEDESYRGEEASLFLPLSEKIGRIVSLKTPGEHGGARAEKNFSISSSSSFLRRLSSLSPSSSARSFLSFLDVVLLSELEERLLILSATREACSEVSCLTREVLGEDWSPSLSLLSLLRRLCSFVVLVYIQLENREEETSSHQDGGGTTPRSRHYPWNAQEEDLLLPPAKRTRERKKKEEEGDGEPGNCRAAWGANRQEKDPREEQEEEEENFLSPGRASVSLSFARLPHLKPSSCLAPRQEGQFASSPSSASSSSSSASSSSFSVSSSGEERRCSPWICCVLRSAWSTRTASFLFVWLAGVLLRACLGLYPYSGEGQIHTGYGDFEAQRHWMEIAFNLPLNTWYTYGTYFHTPHPHDQDDIKSPGRHARALKASSSFSSFSSLSSSPSPSSSSSSSSSASSSAPSSSVVSPRDSKVLWWPLDYPPLSAFLASFFSFFSFLSYPPSVVWWTWRLLPSSQQDRCRSLPQSIGPDSLSLTGHASSSRSSSSSFPSSSSSAFLGGSSSSSSSSSASGTLPSRSPFVTSCAPGASSSSPSALLSRGVEDSFLRVCMRWSVIACDVLLFFSLLFFFSSSSLPSPFSAAEPTQKEKKKKLWQWRMEEEKDSGRTGKTVGEEQEKDRGEEEREDLFWRASRPSSPCSSLSLACACPVEVKRLLLPLILFFFSPPLLAVDHLHFQYNNVALSLVIAAAAFVLRRRDYLATVCFSLAILFKQTSLYYAPAFFSILLARATKQKHRRGRGFKSPKCEWRSCGKASLKILSLGLTVLSVTFLLLLPFLLSSPPRSLSCADQQQTSVDFSHLLSQGGKERDDGARTNSTRRREEGGRNDPGEPLLLLQSYAETLVTIYRRLFPFHRGLFEDYVANFWVVASPFLRLRRRMAGKNDASSSAEIGAPDKPQQAPYLVASVVLTLLGFLPACIGVYRHPTRQRFLQALFCSSSSFFLFSWMVHEKAILLPVTSVLLLTLSHSGIHTPNFGCMYTLMATFSLLHLMQKDRTVFPWSLLIVLYFSLFSLLSPHFRLPPSPSSSSSTSSSPSLSSIRDLQKFGARVSQERKRDFPSISSGAAREDVVENLNEKNSSSSSSLCTSRSRSSSLIDHEGAPQRDGCGSFEDTRKRKRQDEEEERDGAKSSGHAHDRKSFSREKTLLYIQSSSRKSHTCSFHVLRILVLLSRWVFVHLRYCTTMTSLTLSPLSLRPLSSRPSAPSSLRVEEKLYSSPSSSSSSFPSGSGHGDSVAYILKERRERSSQLRKEKKEISHLLLFHREALLSLVLGHTDDTKKRHPERKEEEEKRKDDPNSPDGKETGSMLSSPPIVFGRRGRKFALGFLAAFLAGLQIFVSPPRRFPYLFVYLNCCLHFAFFFCSLVVITVSSWISPSSRVFLEGLETSRHAEPTSDRKANSYEDRDPEGAYDESLLDEIHEPLYEDEEDKLDGDNRSSHKGALFTRVEIFLHASEKGLNPLDTPPGQHAVSTIPDVRKREKEDGGNISKGIRRRRVNPRYA